VGIEQWPGKKINK